MKANGQNLCSFSSESDLEAIKGSTSTSGQSLVSNLSVGKIKALMTQGRDYSTDKWSTEWNFIAEMNRVAHQIGLLSVFANPHGLFHPCQSMSCEDILRLTDICLTYKLFRDIVKRQS